MPLFIKLDFGKNGLIYAWWKQSESDFYPTSSTCAVSAPAVLRKLASELSKKGKD
jgi:hypothetical protein